MSRKEYVILFCPPEPACTFDTDITYSIYVGRASVSETFDS